MRPVTSNIHTLATMQTRRSLLLSGTTALLTAALTGTALADITSLQAFPFTGRVARGQCIQFRARLLIDGRAAPAGFKVGIQERIGSPTATPRFIAFEQTDDKGWIRYQYTVPINPNKDNIHLSASFVRPSGPGIPFSPSQSEAVRVPIGR